MQDQPQLLHNDGTYDPSPAPASLGAGPRRRCADRHDAGAGRSDHGAAHREPIWRPGGRSEHLLSLLGPQRRRTEADGNDLERKSDKRRACLYHLTGRAGLPRHLSRRSDRRRAGEASVYGPGTEIPADTVCVRAGGRCRLRSPAPDRGQLLFSVVWHRPVSGARPSTSPVSSSACSISSFMPKHTGRKQSRRARRRLPGRRP